MRKRIGLRPSRPDPEANAAKAADVTGDPAARTLQPVRVETDVSLFGLRPGFA